MSPSKPEVSDQDVKVHLALGGGKSHEAPIHPAMVGRGQNSLDAMSAMPSIGTAIGAGR